MYDANTNIIAIAESAIGEHVFFMVSTLLLRWDGWWW